MFPVSPNVVPSFSSHNIFSPNCPNIVASSGKAFQTIVHDNKIWHVFFLMTERTQCKYVARSSLIATLTLLTIVSPTAIEIWANNKKTCTDSIPFKKTRQLFSLKKKTIQLYKNVHQKFYGRPKRVCSLPVSIHTLRNMDMELSARLKLIMVLSFTENHGVIKWGNQYPQNHGL